MNRKDYQLIGEVMKNLREEALNEDESEAYVYVTLKLDELFRHSYLNYNSDKFLAACMPDKVKYYGT